jgi:hypothetical protein
MNSNTSNDKQEHWVDSVIEAMENLGGATHLSKIYVETFRLRAQSNQEPVEAHDETVRQTLQANCADCKQYKGGPSYFCMLKDRGSGLWGLNMAAVTKLREERAEAQAFLEELGL